MSCSGLISSLTGGKLETTGNVKQILITYVRMKNEVGDKILLVKKDGILRKTESRWVNKPWTIVSVHTNEQSRLHAETSLNDLTYDE